MVRKRKLVLSVGYWFGAYSLGLLLHPYASMRRVVREKMYRPLLWLPAVVLLVWWLAGLLVAHWPLLVMAGLGVVAEEFGRWGAVGLVMELVWVGGVVFLVLWQGLLYYLYRRFRKLG